MTGARGLALRQNELEHAALDRHETQPAIERERTAVVFLDDRLQPAGSAPDRVSLRPFDEPVADACALVAGSYEELVDPDGVAPAAKRHEPRRVSASLGDEDDVPAEHLERPPVAPALALTEDHPGEPEEKPLVLVPIRPDGDRPVRHALNVPDARGRRERSLAPWR